MSEFSPKVSCKFGDRVVRGTVDGDAVLCESPGVMAPGYTPVLLSNDGATFTDPVQVRERTKRGQIGLAKASKQCQSTPCANPCLSLGLRGATLLVRFLTLFVAGFRTRARFGPGLGSWVRLVEQGMGSATLLGHSDAHCSLTRVLD